MNKGDFSHPRRRPPWWPEGEPWPPHGPPGPHVWGRMRAFFFWRVVGLAALLFVATAGGCTLAFWLAVTDIGPGPWPHVALPFLRFGGVAVGVLALVLMARALRRVAAPVGDLIDAAGRVEAGDYSVRVPERGPREVRALARAFNGMTARLEANETHRRNLLADVTHELRTPVTVIQGNLEGCSTACTRATTRTWPQSWKKRASCRVSSTTCGRWRWRKAGRSSCTASPPTWASS